MRVFTIPLLFAVITVASGLTIPKKYFGHQVLKLHLKDEKDVQIFKEINEILHLDVWRSPKKLPGTLDVRVSISQKEALLNVLGKHSINHVMMIDDLQLKLDVEKAELAKRTIFKAGDHPNLITIDQYHNLAEISAYLDSVASTYNGTVTVGSLGKSYQGNDLKYVKIGKPGPSKKAAFINGCVHAREWLSCATMVYIIDQLTTNATQYSDLLTNLDIYVLPVLNPDGYVYSWNSDRMWRKTRTGPRQGCYGVDANRNWNFKWGVAGSSRNPCDETYDGPNPNSEVEIQAITGFLGANNATIVSYFDIHTYSEDFMYPYGYAEVYPTDLSKIKKIAADATNAINGVNGEGFQYGSITDIVYPASGSSIDYTKGLLNIDYSYAMELRPNGDSFNGFVLPPDQIIAGASECWAGVQVVFKAAYSN
ncbi:hypothetical protein FO519_009486 [Halicephalobus sp. NKZ332]|nr:hypothetical protein FO519_009486 [Halicephalobus sp. NKZ332]